MDRAIQAVDLISHGPTIAQQYHILDSIGVTLTDGQREPFESRARKKLVAGGERGGKSFYTAAELITRLGWGDLFWIIGADYDLCRPEFTYTVEWLASLGAFDSKRAISMPKYGKCTARTKTGQTIQTRTADDIRKIAAKAPSGIVLAEAGQLTYELYLKCLSRLAEKRGWLISVGTLESSSGWYPETLDEWKGPNPDGGASFSIPTWSNTRIFPGGRQDPEILRLEALLSKVPGLFDERCGALPSPPSNIVFGQFRETVHHDARAIYKRGHPVYLAIDPSGGTNPYAVGAFQFFDRADYFKNPDIIPETHLIDCIYETGCIDEEMIKKAKDKPWFKDVAGGAIDVEAPDSKRRWKELGGIHLVSKKIPQIEGIRRLQTFLHFSRDQYGRYLEPPKFFVNPNVTEFAFEVRNYKRMKTGGVRGASLKSGLTREPRETPPDDQPNHLLKATWYLLVGRYGYVHAGQQHKVVNTWRRRLKELRYA